MENLATIREGLSAATTIVKERLSAAMSRTENMFDRLRVRRIDFLLCTKCFGYGDDPQLRYIESTYEFGSIIGAGQTGKVRRCICRSTGQEVACKTMRDTQNGHAELIILHALNSGGGHPGILKFLDGIWTESRHPLRVKYIHVVTELCNGGDLSHKVKSGELLPVVMIARIIKYLVESLKFCHARGVIHRDVKISSILISNDVKHNSWTTKLGNFDRAIHVEPDQYNVYGNVGTVGYSAPEMRSGSGYRYEVDIWSAGVVLYFLLCGRLPFNQAENESTTYEKILVQDTMPDFTLGRWSSICDSAKDLVLGMLQKRHWNRLSCDQILSHPWILSNTEVVVSACTTSRMMASEKTSTSKIDTTEATTSASINEELGFRETASASENVTVTGVASEIVISNTAVDSSTPSNAERGSASIPLRRTSRLTAEMKGKGKLY